LNLQHSSCVQLHGSGKIDFLGALPEDKALVSLFFTGMKAVRAKKRQKLSVDD
jgi:hypothetical protein